MESDDLIYEIETKFKTLMIGTLFRFEESFGYLWNHGEEPTTENQIKFRQKWEDLRTDILNHGNNQIRSAISKLNKFLNRKQYPYNYKFIFKNQDRR